MIHESYVMKRLALDSIRIRNFKAIEDSGRIKLTPLTVLIGENGSGKSSLIEALETLQTVVIENLDDAMRPWKGFNEIWHKGSPTIPPPLRSARAQLPKATRVSEAAAKRAE
jgi:predicted ATPase